MANHNNKIGLWQGAALLATTLLGTSVFILPQMTINIAASNALYTWLGLTLAIIPVALVFGKLAGKYPHASGPAFFVQQAFGVVAGRTIGIIFLLVVPLGAPAAIIMTFQFVDSLISMPPVLQWFTQISVLVLLFVLNFRGIQISAKLQLGLTLIIVAIVAVLLGLSETSSTLTSTSPVVNSDIKLDLILVAAGLAFWSFLGIEAMAHLANDFENPEKDLLPALIIGCTIVGLIYLICTYLQIHNPNTEKLAIVGVFNQLLGGYGAPIIGVLGIAGGIATVNVYTASLARLAWSFSNDGVLPCYFKALNQYGVPVRALNTLLVIMAIVITVTFLTDKHLEDLITWVNGVFVIIYLASMLAAVKLLSRNQTPFIMAGCAFCVALMWGLGWQMSYALILILITAPLLHWQHKSAIKRASPVVATSK
ncbi:L-methionine/branched-chain amino acid transporter [Paraglaciecola sp. 2405UD69-4]|uniref:L-methionine/branched-chain amino acid transporter n=1 Tax=Paraglaciecola sp. 2405UD69-4 TaxID=3391836 RepID=UPI0039C9DC9A